MKMSITKVTSQKKDWGYSAVIIVSFMMIVIIGISEGEEFRVAGTKFDWLYQFMYIPLSATMFSILAFFVASASYRAFRARNFEATLLLIAAFFVMIGRVPVGDSISAFMPEGYRFSDLASWIMNYPQAAGQRAIMIGIGLGIVSTSLRVILGIERSHIGGGD
jgi:diacylglycerol kinase